MIKRIVKMSFRPEEVPAFQLIFKTNWRSIRGFEGCRHVELLQDENDASIFFTYSIWESQAHLDAYRDSELFGKVWGATRLLFRDKPQAWSLKELDFS